MSKIIPIGKSRDMLNKNMVEANKEAKKDDPIKRAAELSKDLKEGQSLPYRRDTILLDIEHINELVLNLTRWANLFTRDDKDALSDEFEYLKVINNVMYTYLFAFDKKVQRPTESKYAQLLMLKTYLRIFKKYATEKDTFVDMDYQPHIFLRTFAGKLSEVAISISLRLKNDEKVYKLSKGYFPRCEKLGYRNFEKDAERKLAFVEKHQAKLANAQREKAVEENGK